MAHFAQLSIDNTVTQVIVVNNADTIDQDGNESEAIGIAFCQTLLGADTRWRQTSYSSRIRKNYASIGFTYDEDLDAFIPPKPFPSWSLDSQTCQWVPPTPYPTDGTRYGWDEESLGWIELPSLESSNA
jgi:hypothetical protein